MSIEAEGSVTLLLIQNRELLQNGALMPSPARNASTLSQAQSSIRGFPLNIFCFTIVPLAWKLP